MKEVFFTLTILLAGIALYGCSGTDNVTLPDSEVQLAPPAFDASKDSEVQSAPPASNAQNGGAKVRLRAKLTDEQRQQIYDTVVKMRETGATPDEIKAAVTELMKGFGVVVPDNWGEQRGSGLCAKLTDEQRQQIYETVAKMRETGATPDEIKAAVTELLKGFGVVVPDNWGEQRGSGLCAKLTDEQRQQIYETVAKMKETGATRDEIKAIVKELLEGFGIDVPDNWGERQKGRKG
jgi:hypothetical protein